MYIHSQWAASPLPTALLSAVFGFLLLLIRLPLILHSFLHPLLCSCRLFTTHHPRVTWPHKRRVPGERWRMLLLFIDDSFFDTSHVKKTPHVSGPGIVNTRAVLLKQFFKHWASSSSLFNLHDRHVCRAQITSVNISMHHQDWFWGCVFNHLRIQFQECREMK